MNASKRSNIFLGWESGVIQFSPEFLTDKEREQFNGLHKIQQLELMSEAQHVADKIIGRMLYRVRNERRLDRAWKKLGY